MRKKVKDTAILEKIKSVGLDVEALAEGLNLSKSNVFYRIRKLKSKGLLNDVKKPVKIEAVADIKENKNAYNSQVIQSQYNEADLIHEVNPEYKHRKIDVAINRYAERNIPVLLIGEAGAGKTEAIKQYSAEKKKPFLRVACDDTSVLKEYIGRREIINGTTYFKTGLLIELLQKPSVILFDEFNCLPSSRLFFLHELLDNRTLFVKEADGGKIVSVHPDCKIFLACNPNSAKYSGTNKINVALADRCSIVNVEQFNIEELKELFDTGNEKNTSALKQFYQEASRVIREQKLRVAFSFRAIKRCAEALKLGDSIQDALQYGFYNVALATASHREKEALEQIARVCFGANGFEGEIEQKETP